MAATNRLGNAESASVTKILMRLSRHVIVKGAAQISISAV